MPRFTNRCTDKNAQQLARRLDGFPLALATAGAFLKHSSFCFLEYLQLYNTQWDRVSTIKLPDYATRTQYTTWDLSFQEIQQIYPEAAQLLTFLAYFNHQDIWFGLLAAGRERMETSWLKK